MKTTALLLFLLVLFPCTSQNNKLENDWKKEGLKGRVQSYNELYYEALIVNDSVAKGALKKPNNRFYFSPMRRFVFNEDGFITMFQDQKKSQHKKYDANKRLTEITSVDTSNVLERKILYFYDKKGKLNKMLWFGKNGVQEAKTDFKYDKRGNLLWEREEESGVTYMDKYSYDKNGFLIEEISLENKEMIYTAQYVNDSLGRVIELQYFEPENHKSVTLKSYDRMGNLISENYKRLDIEKRRNSIYSYAADNKLVEYSSTGDAMKEVEYYDAQGNLVLNAIYELSGKLRDEIRYEYTYDQHGNWTQQITFMNQTPIEVVERVYVYY